MCTGHGLWLCSLYRCFSPFFLSFYVQYYRVFSSPTFTCSSYLFYRSNSASLSVLIMPFSVRPNTDLLSLWSRPLGALPRFISIFSCAVSAIFSASSQMCPAHSVAFGHFLTCMLCLAGGYTPAGQRSQP